jgi:hypothetical protein
MGFSAEPPDGKGPEELLDRLAVIERNARMTLDVLPLYRLVTSDLGQEAARRRQLVNSLGWPWLIYIGKIPKSVASPFSRFVAQVFIEIDGEQPSEDALHWLIRNWRKEPVDILGRLIAFAAERGVEMPPEIVELHTFQPRKSD